MDRGQTAATISPRALYNQTEKMEPIETPFPFNTPEINKGKSQLGKIGHSYEQSKRNNGLMMPYMAEIPVP